MTLKPMLIAASALILSGCANEKDKVTFFSLLPEADRGSMVPVNLPPQNFPGEFWVDRQGCSFIKTDSGQWVPRMNLDRTRMCDADLVTSARKLASTPESGFNAPAKPRIGVDPKTGLTSEIRPEFKIPATYVSVGTYSNGAAGIAVREKFANLGFPIVGRDQTPTPGRALAVVLGPYTDSGFLEDALETAKSLGHNEAYVFQNQ